MAELLSINITKFRNEMRGEFFKMHSALQNVTRRAVVDGFYAGVHNSPVYTGYLHHNWGVAIHGDAHKKLEPRIVEFYSGTTDVKQTYAEAVLPRSISKIRWNSNVELYNDTWYAEEANTESGRPGFYEFAYDAIFSYLQSQQVGDWIKRNASTTINPNYGTPSDLEGSLDFI